MKLVAASAPVVGTSSGVTPVQSVAHLTLSPAATVPVNVIDVATPAVIEVGDMAVIVVPLVAASVFFYTYC